jgi:hypothetical protein
MRRPYLAEICVASALVLTLAVKTATGLSRRDAGIEAHWDVRVRPLLEDEGFVSDRYLGDHDPPLLPVHKPGCSMLIASVSPLGWHRDVLSRIVRPHERLFFVYRGEVFGEQPVWRTSARYHWDRVLSYAGLAGPDEPVLGVIAGRSCGYGPVDWPLLHLIMTARPYTQQR